MVKKECSQNNFFHMPSSILEEPLLPECPQSWSPTDLIFVSEPSSPLSQPSTRPPDVKEEHLSTNTVRCTLISSTMSLNMLTSHYPSSTISNLSFCCPMLAASRTSHLSSSSVSVKWDEEGLETVKEIRKKDCEEHRKNTTDSNAVLNGTTKKGSRRSAKGRK